MKSPSPELNMNWHQMDGDPRPADQMQTARAPTADDSPFSAALVDEMVRGLRVLIVDDEPLNVLLLRHVLQSAGYSCLISTSEAREVASLCQTHAPDLLLLDWMMPHLSGLDVLQDLRSTWDTGEFLPVMVLTADASPSRGARRFRRERRIF